MADNIEKTAKMAVENQAKLEQTQKEFLETTNRLRKDAKTSPMGQYLSGLKQEVSTLKTQLKQELGTGTENENENTNSSDIKKK